MGDDDETAGEIEPPVPAIVAPAKEEILRELARRQTEEKPLLSLVVVGAWSLIILEPHSELTGVQDTLTRGSRRSWAASCTSWAPRAIAPWRVINGRASASARAASPTRGLSTHCPRSERGAARWPHSLV
jgi:hypothetical protein